MKNIKKMKLMAIACLGAIVGMNAQAGGITATTLDDQPSQQLIIKYKAAVNQNNSVFNFQSLTKNLSELYNLRLQHKRVMFNNAQVLKLPKNISAPKIKALLERLNKDASIEYAELDTLMYPMYETNDTLYDQLWGIHGQPAGVNAPQAWDVTRGEGVKVAVLDTGYRPHVDLVANIIGGYDFITSTSIAVDGNGRDSDALDPGDGSASWFFSRSSSWHGTHVAGTVAAVGDNAEGVVGVAYNSQIVPVRVLGKGGGSTSDIADAIVWSSGGSVAGVPNNPNPAQVINMSLGGTGSCGTATQQAINQARANGTTVIVAAGNSNDNAAGYTPASCAGVITVAALDPNGNRSSFSNYGSAVDIAAPGRDILSTLNAGNVSPGADNYVSYNGTSMATPHVAGVAALVLSVYPDMTPDELEQHLKDTSGAFVSGSNCNTSICGAGMVDAAAAVGEVGDVNRPPTADFVYTCNDLACSFTDQSDDADGSVVAWSWSFGDGASSSAQNPSHTYAAEGTYTLELTVTDNEGAEHTVFEQVTVDDGIQNIELSGSSSGFWVRTASLSWSGAAGNTVDIYRNGSVFTTTANDGSFAYSSGFFGSVAGTYKVCEANTSNCSNEITLN